MTKEEQQEKDWIFIADVLFHGSLEKLQQALFDAVYKNRERKDKSSKELKLRLDIHIQEVQTVIESGTK